jgi:hypothetical protein
MVGCSYFDHSQSSGGVAADNALDPHSAAGVIEARVTLAVGQPAVPLRFRTSDDAEVVAREFLAGHGDGAAVAAESVGTDVVAATLIPGSWDMLRAELAACIGAPVVQVAAVTEFVRCEPCRLHENGGVCDGGGALQPPGIHNE